MITVISGSDRKNSNTSKVSMIAVNMLKAHGQKVEVIDLSQLPPNLFRPENYGANVPEILPYQRLVLDCQGLITIVPEYNGSFPGALKYFIDLLKFPESLHRKPAAFIGLATGMFGGVRAVEQLEMVYSYREANLFGQRVFFPKVKEKLTPDGSDITDPFIKDLLAKMLKNFCEFSLRLK